jgi:membrane-bound ClpP family serine protease
MNAFAIRQMARAGIWLAGAVVSVVALPTASAQQKDPEPGLYISVQNPITDAAITQMQNRIDRARNVRKVKKVVFDFNPGNADAATASYGSCLDLADLIRNLNNNGITTIAFVHAKTARHTVLPVLACTDVVMSQDAKLGEVAGPNEVVGDDKARAYALVGTSREAVVMKMLDKNVEVVQGFKAGSPFYIDSAKVGEPRFQDVAVPMAGQRKIVEPKGSIALYGLDKALQYQLCQKSANDKNEILEAYNFYIVDDEDIADAIKAVKIELSGTIDEAMRQKLKGQLKDVASKNENTVFLVLECAGGSADTARKIADELRELRNEKKIKVRTIAFIPNKAPDLATFIAFGCSEIVMFKGSDPAHEAVLGEFEQFLRAPGSDSSNSLNFIRNNLYELAEARGISRLIVDGLLDDKETILYARNKATNDHRLMSGREFEADQRGKKEFVQVRTVKQPGSFLRLDATTAKALRIAQNTVENRDIKEVYTLYGVNEKDVRDSKPGWLDDFAAFIRRTEISILLIIIAFAGLILEFKMPGSTIPGLVSLVCFVLFFWAHAYANGATIYLAIALFVLGLILLGVEIFILPGFGVTGISGVLLILAAVGLATMEKAPSSSEEWTTFAGQLVKYGLSLVAAGIAVALLARYLPKIPYANRLMLAPPTENQGPDVELPPLPGAEQAAALLGQVGAATSMLRPAGMAKFGDQYVDVVTEGDFIEPGTPIQVVEVEGTRIVVKRV